MKHLLISCLALVLIYGCQKEVDFTLPSVTNNNSDSTSCKLFKNYQYDIFGTIADSATYTYSGNKVIKITGGLGYDSLVFQYNGNNITKRIYYSAGTSDSYENLFYNADGTIKLVERFADLSLFGGGMERVDSILFFYSGGKLVQRKSYEINPLGGTGLVLNDVNVFQYTGNNLTKSIHVTSTPDTTIIQYDSQSNFLRKKNFNYLLADINFIDRGTIPDFYALFLSENNPLKVYDSQLPAISQDISYLSSSNGSVLEIKSDGAPLLTYKFQCP